MEVSEDPQQLIRIDSVISVAAVPVNDGNDPEWGRLHPRTRLLDARRAHIVVGTQAGQQVRVLTCKGSVAQAALRRLMGIMAELADRASGDFVYVHGPRGEWPGAPYIWRVTDEIPEPDWPAVRV